MTAWCLLTDTLIFAKVALQCQVDLLLHQYISILSQIHVVCTTLIGSQTGNASVMKINLWIIQQQLFWTTSQRRLSVILFSWYYLSTYHEIDCKGLKADTSEPPKSKPKSPAELFKRCRWLKHGVSLWNHLQRLVSHGSISSPVVSCGIWDIAFIQLCLLWCIIKPFFAPVLLYCSIITNWQVLLPSVSINISVSSTNPQRWLWRCVWWWASTWDWSKCSCETAKACSLLRVWHQGKMKRGNK